MAQRPHQSSTNLHGIDGDGECRFLPVSLLVFASVLVFSGLLLVRGVNPVHANHYDDHEGGDANDNDGGGRRWRCSCGTRWKNESEGIQPDGCRR